MTDAVKIAIILLSIFKIRGVRMKKKLTVVILALCAAVVLLIAGISTGSLEQLVGDKYADVSGYFGNVADNEAVLVLEDGQQAEVRAVSVEGQTGYYLYWETAAELLNSPLYIDEDNLKGILARPDELWYFTPGVTGYDTQDGQHIDTDRVAVIQKEDGWYVSLEYLTQISSLYLDGPHEDTKTIVAVTDPDQLIVKAARPDEKDGGIRVREEESGKSGLLKKTNQVYVLKKGEDWTKVMTSEGYVGYAENKELSEAAALAFVPNAPEYSSITRDHRISLGWHQMSYPSGNDSLAERLEGTQGLNVISPTWFSVTDEQGNISSFASAAYVQQAHEAGLEVWGLIDNFTNQIDDKAFLSSTQARTNMINQLIAAAQGCGMDGINLDFESIKKDEAIHYTQLVRELSIACRKNGLVFSVDDPVPTFSAHYNRTVQGQVADYVIMMGYDEHFSGSTQAGSNASLSFVETGIKDTLEEVPAGKLISAMPFYTRLWIESYENGSLECQTLSMTDANAYATDMQMETYWDAEAGQNVATLDTENNLQKMWLEDEQSLEEKLQLIDTYQLAGGAFWKLGFEDKAVWTMISQYL